MSHRQLREPWSAYRLGDPQGEHPIFSTRGSRREAGRWHDAGAEVVYASRNYSTAMLEKLVYLGGRLPPRQHFIELTIPSGVSYEVVNTDALSGWASSDGTVARSFGARWYAECRSAVLVVPSVVARMEHNLVLHAGHADFPLIRIGLETPVWWDDRLFCA